MEKLFLRSSPLYASEDLVENACKSVIEMDRMELDISKKRPKLEIRRGETCNSDVTALKESQMHSPEQMPSVPITNDRLPSNDTHVLSDTIIEATVNSNNQIAQSNCCDENGDKTGLLSTWSAGVHKENNKSNKISSRGSNEHRHLQCAAFIESKGRQCGRWASDSEIYCCVHLNSHSLEKTNQVDQANTPAQVAICQGRTIHGRRCTHRCKTGSSFCKKHSLQDDKKVGFDTSPMKATLSESNKRTGISLKDNGFSVQENALGQDLQVDMPVQIFGNLSGKSVEDQSSVECSMWNNYEDTMVQEKSFTLNSSQCRNWTRCIGWCRNNRGQCSHRPKPGSSYCEKHFPCTNNNTGKASNRHISLQLQSELLKNAYSEEDKLHITRAMDLLNEIMNVCLLEGTTYHLNSKGRILDWLVVEVSKDFKSAEALLKLVMWEKAILSKTLANEEGQSSLTDICLSEPQLRYTLDAMVERKSFKSNRTNTKSKISDVFVRNPMYNQCWILKCKLCEEEFSNSSLLGHHWISDHEKEAQNFLGAYSCRMCKGIFTDVENLRSHAKSDHKDLLLEHCILISCVYCSSPFMEYSLLSEHVLATHLDVFIQSLHEQSHNSPQSLIAMEFKNNLQDNVSDPLNNEPKVRHFDDNRNKRKSSISDKSGRMYTCRFCGLIFYLLPDLGRHHQAEHMGSNSGKPRILQSRKNTNPSKWRARKLNSMMTQKISSRRLANNSPLNGSTSKGIIHVKDLPTVSLSSEKLGICEKNEKFGEDYCLNVADSLIPEIHVTKPRPNKEELLEFAFSACCKYNFIARLEKKYGPLPEHLCIKAARFCSEGNIRVEWHKESFVCPNNCKQIKNSQHLQMLSPLKDNFNPFIEKSRVLRMDVNDTTIGEWKKAENHVVLTSSDIEKICHAKGVVICEDLSFGKEAVPIPCVIDDSLLDAAAYHLFNNNICPILNNYMQSFSYITKRLLDPSLGLDTKSSQLGCSCTESQCLAESCDHVYLFDNDNDDAEDIYGKPIRGRFPYDEKGRIILEEGFLVYECNSLCKCSQNCPNRVLQKGVQVKLQVYKTKNKGWAVRAAQRISRGTFVCEYLGEVLNDQEANKRGERYDKEGCSYLYDIDAHIDTNGLVDGMQPFVIDATRYGNVARFINHSCSPNLINYQVLVESMDCQLAHIGLYASRDIEPGEELAYDYRYKVLPGNGCLCHCGATNCRGRLY